ncbi:MAG TPA: RNB domain-containing ribonuclease, partial [Casimicrobiaceae bacterium]
ECKASVIRENLVRFERLPIVMRLPDMPNQEPQARVRVAIGRIDLLAPSLEARFAGRIEPESAAPAAEDARAA